MPPSCKKWLCVDVENGQTTADCLAVVSSSILQSGGVEQAVTLVTSCLESTGVWLKGMTVHSAHQLMSFVLRAQLALPSAA